MPTRYVHKEEIIAGIMDIMGLTRDGAIEQLNKTVDTLAGSQTRIAELQAQRDQIDNDIATAKSIADYAVTTLAKTSELVEFPDDEPAASAPETPAPTELK